MKLQSILRTAALLGVVAIAVPAFAKPYSKTINITQAAKVGSVMLQAGQYKLSIDGNKAVVEKGKQTVAEGQGRWEDRNEKSAYDAVLLDANGSVKEVRFSGQKKVFVFNE